MSELEVARAWARRWKNFAKRFAEAWRLVPADASEAHLLSAGPSDRGGFELRMRAGYAARVYAASFMDLLGEAPNCVEVTMVTSTGEAIAVEVRRVLGKSMAQLRDDARAEVERLTSCLRRANEQTERYERFFYLMSDERDAMRDSASKMHRRAQVLEGIEARVDRLRESHAEEIKQLRAEYGGRIRTLREEIRRVRLQLDEACGRLPPSEETASRLDSLASRLDGVMTRDVNVPLIAERLRQGAAAIRTACAAKGGA